MYHRLTSKGLDAVLSAFPEEDHLHGAVARAQRMSLRQVEHHEALVELYMEVIADGDPDAAASRAGALRYWHDHDLRLKVRFRSARRLVEPDAVYEAPEKHTRIFVELDRSTSSHARMRTKLSGYASWAREGGGHALFERVLPPRLLVVTKTDRRRGELANTFRLMELGGLQVTTLQFRHAVKWLRSELFGDRLEEGQKRVRIPAVARPAESLADHLPGEGGRS
jgi:hypothetical protein